MTTAEERKSKDRDPDDDHKLSKETIEDLDPEEEARDVKGGSQTGSQARGCHYNYYSQNC